MDDMLDVEVIFVDKQDLLRYIRLVATELAHDAPFQMLIRRDGEEGYQRALSLIDKLIVLSFSKNLLPLPAAERIREAFFKGAQLHEEIQREALLEMPIDRVH